MFFKLIKYDLRQGIAAQYKKLIAVIALFSAAYADFYIKLRVYSSADAVFPINGSFGDALLSVFGGCEPFQPGVDSQFIFPAVWILMYFLLSYFVLYYPYNNLEDNGRYLLISSGSRRMWWLSKCVWNICSVLLFFILGWCVIFAGCAVTDRELSLGISQNIWMFLNMKPSDEFMMSKTMTFEIMAMPVIVMVAHNLFEMTLSLYIRPIFSFVFTCVITLVSAYFQSPWLMCCYAIPVRSGAMTASGFSCIQGVILSVLTALISVVVGTVKFQRYDIIKRT